MFLIFSLFSLGCDYIRYQVPGLTPPVSYLKDVYNEDLEAEVLGDGIYLVLQHSDPGVMATWPIT